MRNVPAAAAVLAASVLLVLAVAPAAHAQAGKPEPWRPKAPTAADSADAAAATESTAPTERVIPLPPGVQRTLDAQYQPSVPDSVLPFTLGWLEVSPVEQLTTYIGTLRQGAPARPYGVAMPDQKVHVEADGGAGGSHLAIVLLLPWIYKIQRLPHAEATLVVRLDGGAEQKTKLQFTPGPVLWVPGSRPVPVSNPGLSLLPLPPGRHKVEFRVADTAADYLLLLLGQPQLTPLPIQREP
jgi:hypothetical protein